jgi:hypothetical protein
MKRIIVRKDHLIEFVEKKKAEKVFYEIIGALHNNVKLLNESVSHTKANQSVINDYQRKGLITPKIYEMLIKNKIINEKYEII